MTESTTCKSPGVLFVVVCLLYHYIHTVDSSPGCTLPLFGHNEECVETCPDLHLGNHSTGLCEPFPNDYRVLFNATIYYADINFDTPLGTPIIHLRVTLDNEYFQNPQFAFLDIVRNDAVEQMFMFENGEDDRGIYYGNIDPRPPNITIERTIVYANTPSTMLDQQMEFDFDVTVVVVPRMDVGLPSFVEDEALGLVRISKQPVSSGTTLYKDSTQVVQSTAKRIFPPSITAPLTPAPPPSITAPLTPAPPTSITAPLTPAPPTSITAPLTPAPPPSITAPLTPAPPTSITAPLTPAPPTSITAPLTPAPPTSITAPLTPAPPTSITAPLTPAPPTSITAPLTPAPQTVSLEPPTSITAPLTPAPPTSITAPPTSITAPPTSITAPLTPAPQTVSLEPGIVSTQRPTLVSISPPRQNIQPSSTTTTSAITTPLSVSQTRSPATATPLSVSQTRSPAIATPLSVSQTTSTQNILPSLSTDMQTAPIVLLPFTTNNQASPSVSQTLVTTAPLLMTSTLAESLTTTRKNMQHTTDISALTQILPLTPLTVTTVSAQPTTSLSTEMVQLSEDKDLILIVTVSASSIVGVIVVLIITVTILLLLFYIRYKIGLSKEKPRGEWEVPVDISFMNPHYPEGTTHCPEGTTHYPEGTTHYPEGMTQGTMELVTLSETRTEEQSSSDVVAFGNQQNYQESTMDSNGQNL